MQKTQTENYATIKRQKGEIGQLQADLSSLEFKKTKMEEDKEREIETKSETKKEK